MAHAVEPLSTSILIIMYFGDVVFAISEHARQQVRSRCKEQAQRARE